MQIHRSPEKEEPLFSRREHLREHTAKLIGLASRIALKA
jgi:hypothetical protein